MPTATNKINRLREEAEEGELPYFSKSRVKNYKNCPRSFYHTYIEGKRGEETDAMRQGTRVHEVFEDYYDNLCKHYDLSDGKGEDLKFPPEPRDLVQFLPEPVLRWADWMEFMANFLAWEVYRAEQALEVVEDLDWPMDNSTKTVEAINQWIPVGIEEEAWHEPENGPEWMGFADVIVNASSIKEVDTDTGVVIVDFKTGKTPKKRYRNEGIFLEGEYYGMIFDEMYEVSGVAGFYPKQGDFLVSDLSSKRRDDVRSIINDVNNAVDCDGKPDEEEFPIDEQPLCKWGEGEDEQCDFYDECPSKWGVPVEKKELFEAMVDNGNTAYQIADYMEIDNVGIIYYWAKKLNLDL